MLKITKGKAEIKLKKVLRIGARIRAQKIDIRKSLLSIKAFGVALASLFLLKFIGKDF